MKVAIVGRTEMLLRSAQAVAEAGHDIGAVVTCEKEPHYSVSPSDFESLANKHDSAFFETYRIGDETVVNELDTCDVAISINWKTLIPPSVINRFEHGIINCHAGDLPRFRGNAATNWAIIAGEEELVYSLHYMEPALDAGPILAQRTMKITDETYIEDIYRYGVKNVPAMYVSVLSDIENGAVDVQPQPNDPSEVLRCYPRREEDSRLDWTQSAVELDRTVRASAEPLFGAYTYYKGDRLRVWRSSVEHPDMDYLGTPGQVADRRSDDGTVTVVTGEGLLVLETVSTDDNDPCSATEIISSNRDRLGIATAEEIHHLLERVRRLEQQIEE